MKWITDEGTCLQEIERIIGHFYVTKLTLGGVYQKSYVAQMSEGESKEMIKANISASAGFFSMEATSSLRSQSGTSKIDEKTWEKVSCQGGDGSIWLGATKENFETCQSRWAATVSQENAHGVGYKLLPIWNLISKIDPKKGKAYEDFLRNNWNLQNDAFKPSSFLPRVADQTVEIFNGKRVVLEFRNGSQIYVSTNASGGGMRCFGEREGTCSNRDDARRVFRVQGVGSGYVEFILDDGRMFYVSSNVYAGGHACFCERRGAKSNTDDDRRRFKIVPVPMSHNEYVLKLKDERTVYTSTQVVDGGHGVFCEKVGDKSNNQEERRHLRIRTVR